MRGGKSFLLLVVVALALGAYIFFVESKRTPEASATASTSKPVFTAVAADKINDIEVRASSGDVTHLEKQDGTWRIVAPVAVDADANAASGLTSTLAGLTSESTVVDQPAAVKEFGLDPAQSTVTFTTDDKQAHTLLIGGKAPAGGDVYAQVKGQPAVFLIGSSDGDSLNKTTFDLRNKTVLSFPRDTANLLTLSHGQTALTLQKSASDWRLTSPLTGPADFSAVDGVIGRLADLQMKSIVAPDVAKVSAADLKKYGLDKPTVTAIVGAGSTRATLVVGAKTSDNQQAYARDLSRPMIFTVEASLIDDLNKKPFDLRLKDLFAAKSYSILSLTMTQGGVTTQFVKVKNKDNSETWKQAKPADQAVDQTKVGDLVSAVTGLEAQSFADKPAAGGDTIVIATTYGDSASPTSEQVTFHKTDKSVQAVRADDSGAAVISSDDFNKVFTALKALTGTGK